MPPKKCSRLEIKLEEPAECEIILEKVNMTNLSQIVKNEKEEEVLIKESFNAQQLISNIDIYIKQEEPVEFDDTELKNEDDENCEYENAESLSNDEKEEKFDLIKPIEALGSKDLVCKTCNATFKTRTELKTHQKLHANPLKCKKCAKVFKIKKNFDTHKCTYECKICQKPFFRNDNLTQHMNYVHGNWKKSELFTCDCCAKGFKYKKSLVCHMKQHMEVKPLICNICKQGFSVKNTYKQHLLTHSGKVPCKVCGKMLKPSAIYYHMRQAHETSRKFVCTICEASFKTRGDLNSHYGTHDKKHQCSVCFKKFSRGYKLKLHFQIHENPRMFECKKCNKILARKDTLESHEKWCGETFCCGHCDFTTKFPKRLLGHEAKCIENEKTKRFKTFRDFKDSSSDDQDDEKEVSKECAENDLFCKHCNKIFDTKKELSEHIMKIIL
ncbi:unnamed protein product [Chironomus riparius]|uniref:C2H2-type domain-containing protein n=1 Tax=Chironomus riparius TaxID=315576 RepID=A0A9N9WZU3_9DIPT|nr:unnamed protein product [Chironomus riparius]